MDVEVTFSRRLSRHQRMTIILSEFCEPEDTAKLKRTKEAIASFIAPCAVENSNVPPPPALPNAAEEKPSELKSSKPGKSHDPNEPASVKQLDLLQSLLVQRKIPMEEFCKENNIKDIKELKMQEARSIIGDLKDQVELKKKSNQNRIGNDGFF